MIAMTKHKPKRSNVRHVTDKFENGELIGEVVDIEDPDNPKQKSRVVQRVTPLRKLLHRASISPAEYEAGLRFAETYVRAHLGPRYSMTNADRIMVDVSVRNPEQIAADTIAGEECFEIIRAMGERGGSLLECVVGQDMTVQDWVYQRARMNWWGQSITPNEAGQALRFLLSGLVGWYQKCDR